MSPRPGEIGRSDWSINSSPTGGTWVGHFRNDSIEPSESNGFFVSEISAGPLMSLFSVARPWRFAVLVVTQRRDVSRWSGVYK